MLHSKELNETNRRYNAEVSGYSFLWTIVFKVTSRLKNLIIVCGILLGSIPLINAQDTILSHLSTIVDEKLQLKWITTEINKSVLSSPERTAFLATVFDPIVRINPNAIDSAKALNFKGISRYANKDYKGAAESYL